MRPRFPVVTLSQFRFRSANKRGAVAVGGFRWTIQHGFLPFVPDWRYVAWQSLAVARGVLVLIVTYLRTHRLAPLIVAHWLMDIVAAFMNVRF